MVVLREEHFCGRIVTGGQLEFIKGVVEDCAGITRTELAHTICELLSWRRPNGRLKARECREFLEKLESRGFFELPGRKPGRPVGSATGVGDAAVELVHREVEGRVDKLGPVFLKRVREHRDRALWRQAVERYHYLGYKVPFGAHLTYLIYLKENILTGGLQFSSAAWRIRCRDEWIGWDDGQRRRNLQKVVCNSRFLILPWVKVGNLASKVLSLAVRHLAEDWQKLYRVRPVLVETLVDVARYQGRCYVAANWRSLGMSSGRGRMDREGKRHGAAPKAVFVYPLVADFRSHLVL